jgi:hypothetical protein
MPRTDFFHVQFEVLRVKSRQLFYKKNCGRASVLTFTLGILSGFGTSSASNQRVCKELSAPDLIDLYHNFEQQKIEFKSFDQQSDVSMRGL